MQSILGPPAHLVGRVVAGGEVDSFATCSLLVGGSEGKVLRLDRVRRDASVSPSVLLRLAS